MCTTINDKCIRKIYIYLSTFGKNRGFFCASLLLKMHLGINFFWILGSLSTFRLFHSYESKKVSGRFPNVSSDEFCVQALLKHPLASLPSPKMPPCAPSRYIPSFLGLRFLCRLSSRSNDPQYHGQHVVPS